MATTQEHQDEEVGSGCVEYSTLTPPRSGGERTRDALLRLLDGTIVQYLGLLVLFVVVLDGAFFFFLLIGAQRMCRPRTDCDPRNWWYNFSIQVLNILFTYMATVSMPWRCTNAIHLMGVGCPVRSNANGKNLYGLDVNDIWFHIPLVKRRGIILFLLLNCITQYANQVTRIVFYSFSLQNTSPGNIWTNVFFASSMICAAVGGGWQGYEESKLQKAYPDKFPPGFLDLIGQYLCCKAKNKGAHPEPGEHDPTRTVTERAVFPTGRSSMRLWGM